MARPAFNRDGILNDDERAASARKCLSLLSALSPDVFSAKQCEFVSDQLRLSKNIRYGFGFEACDVRSGK